jgi:hypothetical protein
MLKKIESVVFMSCLVLGAIFFWSFSCEANWIRTYGGPSADYGSSSVRTSDGGYIVTGTTGNFGAVSSDCLVLKLDSGWNMEWQKIYGASGVDSCLSIRQTEPDLGYIVAGATSSSGAGGSDVWLLKLDGSGNVEWQKTYGGSGSDQAVAVSQTDSGYIVAAQTSSFGMGSTDFWLLNLDTGGNILWQRSYGGASMDFLYDLQTVTGGGYIVAGQTMSFGAGGNDALLLKVDADGNIVWQKTYGGTLTDWAGSIQKTVGGGYIVLGETSSFGAGDRDIWILKIDEDGEIAWQKTYGGPARDEGDGVSKIRQTSDLGYIVTGITSSFGAGGQDAWLLKLDANGNVTWQRSYGGAKDDWVYLAEETVDGGYIMAGNTRSFGAGAEDIWLLKLEADGSLTNCPFSEVTNATVIDTSVTGIISTAVMTATAITPADTTIVPADSTAASSEICPFSSDLMLKVGATKKRQGEGAVSSFDGLISCPDACQIEYTQGFKVTLLATPTALSTFMGWKPSSLACEGTNSCQVTMDKKKSVKAIFQGPNKLKVVTTFKNAATGAVTSGDALINCPGDCEELYILNAPVTLTANPGVDSTFVKWTGKPCKDATTNVCTFTMEKNTTVKAIFELSP